MIHLEKSHIILSELDYQKITTLLSSVDFEVADQLEEELERAQVVPENSIGDNVVRMNSEVTFEDLGTGQIQTVQLVYPHDANVDESKISVFAPIGAALIGLQVGQTIDWPLKNNKVKKLKVVAVSKKD